MKACVNCGAELPDQAKFCAKCGTPASEPTPADAAAQPETATPMAQAKPVAPTDQAQPAPPMAQTITPPPAGGFTQAPGTGSFTQAPASGNFTPSPRGVHQTSFTGAGPVVPDYTPSVAPAAPGVAQSAPGATGFGNANAPMSYTPSYSGHGGKSKTKKFSDFDLFDYLPCGAALLLIISCFLPAFTAFGFTINWLGSGLTDGATDGIFFIIVAILTVVFTFFRKPVANLVVGIICALLVLFEFFNTSSQALMGYTSIGFWLALLMLLVLAVLNILKFVKRNN